MSFHRVVLSAKGRGNRVRQLSAGSGVLRSADEAAEPMCHSTELHQPCQRQPILQSPRLYWTYWTVQMKFLMFPFLGLQSNNFFLQNKEIICITI